MFVCLYVQRMQIEYKIPDMLMRGPEGKRSSGRTKADLFFD